ncbi:MAG: hypothetical protein ABI921_00585 [Panacibacter sp.]
MKKKKELPQLDLFEAIIPVEDLQPDDHFRLSVESPNVYVVKEQFDDIAGKQTKAKLLNSYNIYFIKHGRKVFKKIAPL